MNTNTEQSQVITKINRLVVQLDELKQSIVQSSAPMPATPPTPAPQDVAPMASEPAAPPQNLSDRINQAIDKSHNIPTRHNTTGVTHIIIHATPDRLRDTVSFSIKKIMRDETVIEIHNEILTNTRADAHKFYQCAVDISDFNIIINFTSITDIIDVNFVCISNKCISYNTKIDWPKNVRRMTNTEILDATLDITSRVLDTYNNLRYTINYGLERVDLKFNYYTDNQKLRTDIAYFAMNMITYAFINDK